MSTAARPSLPRSPSRRRATPARLAAVGAIAVIGGVLGILLSDASPTMWSMADAAYRAMLVAACAVAGSRARRWTLVWSGAIATAAGGLPLVLVSGAATILAAGMLMVGFRDRVLGAAIGASVGLCVLDLVRPEEIGATAAVAAIAVIPMLFSGVRWASRRSRQVLTVLGSVGVVLGVAAVAGAALFGLDQQTAVTAAVGETRVALGAATSEDTEAATNGFRRAANSFAEIGAAGDVWWLAPARAAPVVGPNVNFVRTAASSGADLALVAADLSTVIDQDALRAPTGGVDLAVLASTGPPVTAAVERIDAATVELGASNSPWLVPPVRDGLEELLDELGGAGDAARTAELAVQRIPDLLGAERPMRYLMLLGNPAESRDLGGHIGNWAELVAADGQLELTEIGQPYDLSSPSTSPPPTMTPGAYPQALMELRPQYFPQNWGGAVDFPTVARLAAELYPQARPGPPLDGVIYADPAAFAALLNFTGPEPVPGTDIVLTPDNAEEFLTTGQFVQLTTELEGNRAVTTLIDRVVRRFGTSQLPSPRKLVDVLGPMVDRGSLQFVSFDDRDAPLVEELGLSGAVERPGSGDLLSVLTRNTNPSKADIYLERSTQYDVDWDPISGDVDARLVVTLTNTAPTDGLPKVVANPIPGLGAGTNRTTLSVLSPWSVRTALLDDAPTNVGTQQELRGVRRHNVLVDVPAGETRVVELELAGSVGPGTPYLLQWIGQPTAVASRAMVRVSSTTDLGSGARTATVELDGAEDRLLEVRSEN